MPVLGPRPLDRTSITYLTLQGVLLQKKNNPLLYYYRLLRYLLGYSVHFRILLTVFNLGIELMITFKAQLCCLLKINLFEIVNRISLNFILKAFIPPISKVLRSDIPSGSMPY